MTKNVAKNTGHEPLNETIAEAIQSIGMELESCVDSDKEFAAIVDALETLAAFAEVKRDARRLRLEGSIQRASETEQNCDRIYESLPDNCKW